MVQKWLGWLATTLAALAAPAEAAPSGWRVATSPHFVIYSRESTASLQHFADRLELFDAALRHLFPVGSTDLPPAQRITIYALDGAGAVQRVMGAGSANVYGAYKPSIVGPLALTARENSDGWQLDTQIVLLHEYAHHFMLSNFPAAYPTWLVEGFAEFASTARFPAEGGVGIGAPAMHRGWDLLSASQPVSWGRMIADDVAQLSSDDRSSLYARAWLATHMLFFDPARAGQLGRYLAAANGGSPPEKAAEQAFGDPHRLAVDLESYQRRPQMSYLVIKPGVLHPAPVTVTEASPAESAAIPVRIESKWGVGRAEARSLIPAARRVAAIYPTEPVVQCMLAEAENDAENFAEADAAADRLLAADPNGYCGLLYKGENASDRALARKAAADDKEWATARGWYAKANRADGENPLPMFRYYQTYLRAGAKPSANAADALLGAALRAPEDSGVRVLATGELLRRHEDAAARGMLGPVTNSAHNSAGAFLADVYRQIGHEPDEKLAERLAAGPTDQKAAAAAGH